jgi:hypothetical protein
MPIRHYAHVYKSCGDPAASDLFPQNDCTLVVEADQCRVFLPISMPIVCGTVAAVLWDMTMFSSCFYAPGHFLNGSGREHGRSIPFSDLARCLTGVRYAPNTGPKAIRTAGPFNARHRSIQPSRSGRKAPSFAKPLSGNLRELRGPDGARSKGPRREC